ncbi:hypothetical protein SAMD00023353_1000090 [Rosellinia necatrix]|uniref:Uncharacterized protein n=1 Tax=Rosellinia necatrix TaxID=77044 RepID=A0A1S8A7B1_ROSNE|nr:hypothetical protein SAMD00023353_1000090 [Rosellinia necatrix]
MRFFVLAASFFALAAAAVPSQESKRQDNVGSHQPIYDSRKGNADEIFTLLVHDVQLHL